MYAPQFQDRMRLESRWHQAECGYDSILMNVEIAAAPLVGRVEAQHEIANLVMAWHGRFRVAGGRNLAPDLRPDGIEQAPEHLTQSYLTHKRCWRWNQLQAQASPRRTTVARLMVRATFISTPPS